MTTNSKDRLIDALERLSVDNPPSLITMRMIAAEAGVSVGLAYYHFESKDDLIGETLTRMGRRIAEANVVSEVGGELARILDVVDANPAFSRLVASLVLHDRDVSSMMAGHPLIERIAARATSAGAADPEAVAGVAALLGLASSLFVPTVNRAIGRPPNDVRIRGTIADMYDTWLGGPDRT